jgi:hypothetical protein
MRHGRRRPLTGEQIERTGAFIAAQQEPDGGLPWFKDGKMDPWDHVQAAMGLALTRQLDRAEAAFRYLVQRQESDGAWAAWRERGRITDETHETNHAAYVATGLWYLHRVRSSTDFLAEMWPMLERAIDFVVSLQQENGVIFWATNKGKAWRQPLLTGSASTYGSLVCAVRIAERLDRDRPRWRQARDRLARLLRGDLARFRETDLEDQDGRYSMDWYYPVLGGAVRGSGARLRLLDTRMSRAYLEEGVGCRCVADQPWYTTAETCELVMALDACGLSSRAAQMFSWIHPLRTDEGGYWTGVTHPDRVLFPEGEQTAWTAATVLMAADVLVGESPTAAFFKELAGDDLDEAASDLPTGTGDVVVVQEGLS